MYKCPKCKQTKEFHIAAETSAYCWVDGEGEVLDYDTGDLEWDKRHWMSCDECNHDGQVHDFETED